MGFMNGVMSTGVAMVTELAGEENKVAAISYVSSEKGDVDTRAV